ncbi:MAG: hypothetical protein HC907_14230 [Richelia sp. SM1_7_0]|nr:hypothetical protein [Richelia sp. SM1_7_0]
MSWFFFAISTAFLESVRDIFNKKTILKVDEYVITFSLNLLTALFSLPLLLFNDIPILANNFGML